MNYNIVGKYFEWREVWGAVWGSIYFNADGTVGCHNTFNERTWTIQTVSGKDYIIFIGDGAETAWVELSEREVMFGRNTEGKIVSLRRYGGASFRNTVVNAMRCPNLVEAIQRLGIVSHNNVVPHALTKWDGVDWFIGLQQNPIEFADYLQSLNGRNIKTYLEIGTFCGGTFIATLEYMKSLGMTPHGIACDVFNRESTFAYANEFGGCEIHNVNSASVNFDLLIDGKNIDLVLIDADHAYNGVKNDWLKMKGRAKIVAFHDIVLCDGVKQLWKEIVAEGYKTQEFVHDRSQLGIGVVFL